MGSGRIFNKDCETRNEVETVLFALTRSRTDLDELELRTRQAMRRAPHTRPVLEPALERLEETRQRVSLAERFMARVWKTGQARLWKEPEDES